MRKAWILLVMGCSLTLRTYADCVLPPAPTKVPDGATATEQELVQSMQILKQFANDVGTYLKCLKFAASQSRLTQEQEMEQHNEAVDTLERVTAKFNEQVRVFKARKQ